LNVFVLGGTGFIGNHIVKKLLDSGFLVTVGCRNIPVNKQADVRYREIDILTGRGLSVALDNIDLLIHCASATVPASAAADPINDINSNLIGTLNLLEAMRQRNVDRIIYLSSGGTVYGEPEFSPVPESHPLKPISSYGVVKAAIERYIDIASREWGLRSTIFRPSNPFGEGQVSKGGQGLIPAVIECAMNNRPITVFGDGNTIRDYIYVSDLADLIVKSISSNHSGVFNAGSGLGFSTNEILDTVESVTGITVQRCYADKRKFDIDEIILDVDKTQQMFSWCPETSLAVGIEKQYCWLRGIPIGCSG